MNLKEIQTEKQFMNFFQNYGNITICIFEYYGIEKRHRSTYSIIYYKDKHETNKYNNSEVRKKESTIQECLDFIKYESRKFKIKKLQLNIKNKSILNIN